MSIEEFFSELFLYLFLYKNIKRMEKKDCHRISTPGKILIIGGYAILFEGN